MHETPQATCPTCGSPLPADAPRGLCPQCLLEHGRPGTAEHAPPPGRDAAELRATAARLQAALPDLEIEEVQGEGGMGVVFRARQKQLGRTVAVKVLTTSAADDPAFAERFAREARALAKLNHPNIVAVHDFGTADGLHYLVMEYVEGANLRELLRGKKLPPEQALAIVPQICDALQYAHDEGGRAPRHQAGEHPAGPRGAREDRRLRAGQALGARRPRRNAHRHRPGDGHAPLHGARSSSTARWRSTTGPTSSPSALCSTSCSPASCPWAASARRRSAPASIRGSTASC